MDKFEALQELGAGDFQHLNGSLEAHLKGTQNILKSWNSSELLQTAGLFHAAYGTAAFTDNMVSLDKRQEIADVIGKDEEALVYLYCSCDRDFVFGQLDQATEFKFKDRFTNKEFALKQSDAQMFCELTVANELELVYASNEFKQKYGADLYKLFKSMHPYLTDQARQAYTDALVEFT